MKRRGPVGAWVVLSTLGGLLMTAYRHLDEVANRSGEPLLHTAINEMTGVWGAALLLYLLLPILARFPVSGARWRPRLALHGAVVLAFSFVHTSMNWGLRIALNALVGMAYDYGEMPTRYLMELPIDVIGYTMALILVGLVERSRAAGERELQILRLQEQLQRAQLASLQARMRPHFLFNALNTVSSVMYEDVDKADRVLQSLADLLRRMVDEEDRTQVPLSEELALVESYAEIMAARFGGQLSVEIDVDRGGPSADDLGAWPVPPLLLQPVVENAIQHGRPADTGPLTVRIGARAVGRGDDRRLQLTVDDNGPGVVGDPSLALDQGVGLRTTAERLRTLYGPAHGLSLENGRSGGLRVTIELPARGGGP